MTTDTTVKPIKRPKTEIAKRMIGFRKRQRMSRREGAEMLGVGFATLRSWEACARQPSAATVRLITVLEILEMAAPAVLVMVRPPPPSHEPEVVDETDEEADDE